MPGVLWRTPRSSCKGILLLLVGLLREREKNLCKWDAQGDINFWTVKMGNNRKDDIDRLTEKVVAL